MYIHERAFLYFDSNFIQILFVCVQLTGTMSAYGFTFGYMMTHHKSKLKLKLEQLRSEIPLLPH